MKIIDFHTICETIDFDETFQLNVVCNLVHKYCSKSTTETLETGAKYIQS